LKESKAKNQFINLSFPLTLVKEGEDIIFSGKRSSGGGGDEKANGAYRREHR
jgi:hypothetical protein